MLGEDESVLLQVSENHSYITNSNTNMYLKLENLELEIWGFIYQCSSKEYLIILNENHKGKTLRRVYDKSIKIIDCNLSFLDYMIYIITKDNLK